MTKKCFPSTYQDKKLTSLQKVELLLKCKESCRELGKENFFGIRKSSDMGRYFENVLRKFRECGPRTLM